MSERKVINKYVKTDDIYQKKIKKGYFSIRYMIPFNIKCLRCLNTINKGKKINAIKENILNRNYLGISIVRFYFKCIYCLNGISIKTNPNNFSYSIEINSNR
jgi:hypothetical protein